MSGSVNKVIMIGNLGADPEIRFEPDKYNVCTLSIATSRDWKDQNSGETKSQTYWHRVVIWEPNAVKYAKDYLKSGTLASWDICWNEETHRLCVVSKAA